MKKQLFALFLLLFVIVLIPSSAFCKESVYNETKTVKFNGGQRSVNAIYIDLNDKSIRVETNYAKNKIGSTDDLKNIAELSKDANTEVVAAINGSYFNAYTDMIPFGTLISKGDYIRLGDTGSTINFTADNTVNVDWLSIKIKGAINDDWDYTGNWYAWNFNSITDNSTAVEILTPAFGKTTGNINKTCIVVDNGKVTQIKTGGASIPENGYVIVTSDAKIYKKFKLGDKVDYIVQTFSKDSNGKLTPVDLTDIRSTIGAGPILLKNGVIYADGAKEGFKEAKVNVNRSIRSMAGVTKNNTLIIATVPNVTVKELAQIAKTLGCVDAITLDCGASTGMYYKGKVVTTPGRKLSNALVITKLKNPPQKLKVDGKPLVLKSDIYTDTSGELMLPFKDFCNSIFVQNSISGNNLVADIKGISLKMTLSSSTATYGNKKLTAKCSVISKNGVIYIPASFITSAFGSTLSYDSASKTYSMKLSTCDVNKLLFQAVDEKNKSNYIKAESILQKVLDYVPDNTGVNKQLAYLYHTNLLNNPEKRLYYLEKYNSLVDDDFDMQVALGWAYYSAKQLENAVNSFGKATKLNPDSASSWYALGVCYQSYTLKQYQEALDCYNKALKCKSITADLEQQIKPLMEQCKAKLND